MTISEEARELRAEVVALGEGTGRKYSIELRQRILNWVGRAIAAGWVERRCGKDIDVPHHRFAMWREYAKRFADAPKPRATKPRPLGSESSGSSEATKTSGHSLALVPVTIRAASIAAAATLTTPNGYRVEGLTIEQLAALLRELS